MEKREFAKKFAPIAYKLNQLKLKAITISESPIESEEDISRTREAFLMLASEFKELEEQHNSIPAPAGYESDVEELRNIFTEYVNSIYMKSKNFSLQGLKDGTINFWNEKERESVMQLNHKTKMLADKMFK